MRVPFRVDLRYTVLPSHGIFLTHPRFLRSLHHSHHIPAVPSPPIPPVEMTPISKIASTVMPLPIFIITAPAHTHQNPIQLPAHLELAGSRREGSMHDGVSRSACLSEASCAEGSDHAWTPGQLYWAALSFRLCPSGYCFVSFLGRPRKEMKFPNGIHWKKKKMGRMTMDSYSIYGTNAPSPFGV